MGRPNVVDRLEVNRLVEAQSDTDGAVGVRRLGVDDRGVVSLVDEGLEAGGGRGIDDAHLTALSDAEPRRAIRADEHAALGDVVRGAVDLFGSADGGDLRRQFDDDARLGPALFDERGPRGYFRMGNCLS